MRWRPHAVLALCASGLALGGGCDKATAPASVGASIAVVSSGVVVANSDQGSVSVLDPETLAVRRSITVGGEPHALLPLRSGLVLVATYRGGEIVAIDPSRGTVVARGVVCSSPYGLAESADHAFVLVTCEWEGSVLRVDPVTLAATVLATGLRRPRAIAMDGAHIYVADWIGGLVHDVGGGGATSLVPTNAPSRPALTKMSANLVASIVPAFGQVFALHVLENNTGDTSEPVADDYGTVAMTNSKINPVVTALGGASPMTYARYDGGTRVYSGPSAMAAFGSHYLLVAHVSTGNVAVLDVTASDDARTVATFRTGLGASGIAVDQANNVAYVDNALDQSVSRIDLSVPWDKTTPRYDAQATLVRALPSPYSAAALAGRQFFFDATNSHVTPSGVVACASCHPSGTDDGLVWLEHTSTIPLRRRRTKHLANAKSSTAPFHWDGQFQTMTALAESTMTNLMGGDGLLVDVSTVQAYVDEIVKAPVLPAADADAAARGRVVFESPSVACSSCHSGSDYTDNQMHAVLSPESLTPDDVFTIANTPALHGIFASAPYFHDGRAADLDAVLHSGMGDTSSLSTSELGDLATFLRSL